MCRLMIANKKDFMAYDKKYGVLAHWKYLENQCGGQGNGCAIITPENKLVYFKKGVKLEAKRIYKDVIKELKKLPEQAVVIFHTRIASVASVKDTNCHPFKSERDNFVLAMNGTESDLSRLGNVLGITDTQIVFKLVKDKPLDEIIAVLEKMNSVYIGFKDGSPFAINNRGELAVWDKGSGSYHASSFPYKVKDVKETDYGYIWNNYKSNELFYVHKEYSTGSEWATWKPKAKANNKFAYDNLEEEYDGYYDGFYYNTKSNTQLEGFDEAYSIGYNEGVRDGSNEAYENLQEMLDKSYDEGYAAACKIIESNKQLPEFEEKGEDAIGF